MMANICKIERNEALKKLENREKNLLITSIFSLALGIILFLSGFLLASSYLLYPVKYLRDNFSFFKPKKSFEILKIIFISISILSSFPFFFFGGGSLRRKSVFNKNKNRLKAHMDCLEELERFKKGEICQKIKNANDNRMMCFYKEGYSDYQLKFGIDFEFEENREVNLFVLKILQKKEFIENIDRILKDVSSYVESLFQKVNHMLFERFLKGNTLFFEKSEIKELFRSCLEEESPNDKYVKGCSQLIRVNDVVINCIYRRLLLNLINYKEAPHGVPKYLSNNIGRYLDNFLDKLSLLIQEKENLQGNLLEIKEGKFERKKFKDEIILDPSFFSDIEGVRLFSEEQII